MTLILRWTTALIWVPLFSALPVCGTTSAKDITVVFRYDDPSARSNIDIERQLIDEFRRHGMSCTFAVVPYVCDGDVHDPSPQQYLPLPGEKAMLFASAVQEGVLEIALHGYSHQTNEMHPEKYSEFAGLDYGEQVVRIERGREFLETQLGWPVLTFVPPWNTHDTNTLRAVERAGFRCVSSDMYGTPSSSAALRFVPATCELGQVKEGVRLARQIEDPAPLIVVLFHEYDFIESGSPRASATLRQLAETLRWLSTQNDVAVRLMQEVPSADAVRYTKNHWLRRVDQVLPLRLRATSYRPVYLSAEGLQDATRRTVTTAALFYTGLVLLVAATSYLVGGGFLARISPWAASVVVASEWLLLIGGSIWTLGDGQFGARGVASIATALGWCVGNSVAAVLRHRCDRGKTRETGPALNGTSIRERAGSSLDY
ncbi:MAG TPA: DUF2334 domain-containing protein [Sedimentisphaerales bacterium]|nr:DUF2334 domain-containing protein [Sedimentisphaerales bacterium]